MHISNGPQYSVEQMSQHVGVNGAYTVLHIQMLNDPLLGGTADHENGDWYMKLRTGDPRQPSFVGSTSTFINIRIYHPNTLSQEPVAYADHYIDLLANWTGSGPWAGKTANLWADPFVGVHFGNELNLHYENGDSTPANQWKYQTEDHYRRIVDWQMRVWDRIDQRLGRERKAISVFSPFAYGHEPPGHEPGGEYTLAEVRALIERMNLIAIHPYAHLDWANGQDTAPGGKDAFWHMLNDFRPKGFKNDNDPGGVMMQYPNKTFIVAETGTFTHSDKFRTDETWKVLDLFYRMCAGSGRVLGVTPFIWHSWGYGPKDAGHWPNMIWPNESLRDRFANSPRYATSCQVPLAWDEAPPPPPPPPAPDPSPEPVPTPGPGFVVGDGVLAAMTARGDSPASGEAYTGNPGQQVSFTLGVKGNVYIAFEEAGWKVAVL